MNHITSNTSVAEIVKVCPGARRIFDEHGLKGCGGEHGPTEPLAFFAAVHQANLDELLREINTEMANPSAQAYVYKESLQDYIYRRFFKAGVAIVLTVGCLWGAINLLQIGLGKSFLQLRLLSSIHAHAHAMIFGWVGMFVMGFAYQSFPRFKNTTLWRPELANLSFCLLGTGIVAGMLADMLLPALASFVLGAVSGLSEITAVVIFMLVLHRTARQSIEPHNPYEKFIASSFVWFLLGTILEAVFFFAKATAHSEHGLIMRIALIDGPLRDIQLLGFAALIIAGVSQRFVPHVYGLGKPVHDRQTLIFWLINGSLLLNIINYVLLLITHNFYFAIGVELAYLLMPVWAVLLAIQIGVFRRPTQPDRTFKFVRAAYVWLVIACGMMPLFPLYGVLTHQVFAHTYMGSHRHAFTVGFISMMILGVSSRVVPILAGIDAKQMNSLWAPFLLFNAGCAGRVVLQILTDFVPNVAYPLIGFTGFIELSALLWWGIELWRIMNIARTRHTNMVRAPFPLAAR
ncbi:MAG TPA: NnrS family protein [Candidatus Dormibacteraeota bacterium]|nr:NnrS family protein [Candidatus Dormibacteraeota bacterium]